MIPGFQPPQNDAVFRRAAPLIASAGDWITGVVRGNSQAPADWAVSLLGAGPGLTPSGDDVLGGALLALRATGHANVAEALWRQIAPELTLRTNEISATLLAAAAMGHGSAAVHEVISALTGGAPPALDGALAAIDRIGHSSGWDTLLGVVTVLDTLAITPLNRAA